ncbi:MAG: DivIVA domain-containing protein [Actinomycetota bacterium]
MSSTELDLPVVPSADQIRKREFASVRRGYDPDQVRDYLKQIGDQIELMEEQLKEARTRAQAALAAASDSRSAMQAALDRAKEAERRPVVEEDPYKAVAEKMADVMRSAEAKSDELLANAQRQSADMAQEARAEADRIRIDAQEKAEGIRGEADLELTKAKEEADRLLSGLHSRRDALMGELEHMRERMLQMARSLGEVASPPEGMSELPPLPGSGRKFFSEDQLEELWSKDADVADLQENVDLSLPDIPPLETADEADTVEEPEVPREEPAPESRPPLPLDAPTYNDPITERTDERRDDPWSL